MRLTFLSGASKFCVILPLALGLTLTISVNAQQIGSGYAPTISNFSDILLTGAYTGYNPVGSAPTGEYQHLFVVRHGNGSNNYQLQMASSLVENDKLYFRKIAAGDLSTPNPSWIEIATRGSNFFTAAQTINGELNLLNYNGSYGAGQKLSFGHSQAGSDVPIAEIQPFLVDGSQYRAGKLIFRTSNQGVLSDRMTIQQDGSVLIGSTSSNAPLDVKGNIVIGANSNPTLDFISNDNSIINRASGKSLHFTEGYNSTQLFLKSGGNVGIGTTSPGSCLSVVSGQNDILHLSRSTGNADDNIYLAFSHGNNTSSSNVRARIGTNIKPGGYGRLTFHTGTEGNTPEQMRIDEYGNVGIGTPTPSEKLSVNGTIRSKEVKVEATGWPDYVFENSFSLTPLSELETYVKENHHLPEVPSEQEVLENGVELSATVNILLKKIEELTLYIIEENKKNETQAAQIELLKAKNLEFQNQLNSLLNEK